MWCKIIEKSMHIVSSYYCSVPGKLLYQDTYLPPLPRQKDFQNSCLFRYSNSFNAYLFLNSELKLGKSKESNNQDKKMQFKRSFEIYSLFVTKKKKKNNKGDKFYLKFSWTPTTIVEFSVRHVYVIMIGEDFQIHGVQITGKCICKP